MSVTFSFQHLPNPYKKKDEKHDLYRGFLISKEADIMVSLDPYCLGVR